MTFAGERANSFVFSTSGSAFVVALFALAGWACAAVSTFDPWLALAKLAIAGVHLVLIGRACGILLRLERPPVLALAHDALLGQVVGLAYVYIRSSVSDAFALPGISSAETFFAEALLLFLALRRVRSADLPSAIPRENRAPRLVLVLIWLGWLVAIALQKLDLHFTPSSDPDIHAWYAKRFVDLGRIYYDLLPASDAWMVYPSTFGSLNLVWGRFSGLHPVQLVNLSVYLQFTLYAGASFSILGGAASRTGTRIGLAVLHFAFAYVGFNAVFAEQRAFLEGTPRLAHTALLFFPLFFALQHRASLARRPRLWMFPAIGVALGACVNPTHVPASLLIGAGALAVARGSDGSSANRRAYLASGLAALAVALLFFFSDPFYRGLALQQRAPDEARETATDLTGSAFAAQLDVASIVFEDLPGAVDRLLGNQAQLEPERLARRTGLLLLAVMLAAHGFRMRRQQPNPDAPEGIVRLALASFVIVLLHGIWSESASTLGQPEVLQTRLLNRYSQALQEQLERLFFTLVPGLIFALSTMRRVDAPRWKESVAVCALVIASVPFLWTRLATQQTSFYGELRNSPLGAVYASDAAFAVQIQSHVAEQERVLLPGRLRRIPGEHWIFTTDAGRAVALFSDVRTSFFLGLDGWAFTAGAYEAHVQPSNFDPTWLRAKNVLWLFDSGSFPPRLLNAHYTSVARGENAILWRLRDAPLSLPAKSAP